MSKIKTHPEFGQFIGNCPMKDNSILEAYINGNTIYFVTGNKIEKSLHIEDMEGVVGALMNELGNVGTD